MRRLGDSPESIEFSAAERAVLAEMCRMTGCTIPNLIRTALWHYADFLEVDVDSRTGVFDERHGSGQWPRQPKRKAHDAA